MVRSIPGVTCERVHALHAVHHVPHTRLDRLWMASSSNHVLVPCRTPCGTRPFRSCTATISSRRPAPAFLAGEPSTIDSQQSGQREATAALRRAIAAREEAESTRPESVELMG